MTRFFIPSRAIGFSRSSQGDWTDNLGSDPTWVELVGFSCDVRCVVRWQQRDLKFSTVSLCLKDPQLLEELIEHREAFTAESASRFLAEAIPALETMPAVSRNWIMLLDILLSIHVGPVKSVITDWVNAERAKNGGPVMSLINFRLQRRTRGPQRQGGALSDERGRYRPLREGT